MNEPVAIEASSREYMFMPVGQATGGGFEDRVYKLGKQGNWAQAIVEYQAQTAHTFQETIMYYTRGVRNRHGKRK